MACLEDSQIHTSAAILILHCERNLGRVKRRAEGPVEEDRRRSSEIVSWMTLLGGLGEECGLRFFLTCLFVQQFQRNSIAVLLGHLLLFSLSSFHVQIVFQMEGQYPGCQMVFSLLFAEKMESKKHLSIFFQARATQVIDGLVQLQ